MLHPELVTTARNFLHLTGLSGVWIVRLGVEKTSRAD